MKHTSSRYEYVVYVKKYNYKTNVNSLHRVYLSRACKKWKLQIERKDWMIQNISIYKFTRNTLFNCTTFCYHKKSNSSYFIIIKVLPHYCHLHFLQNHTKDSIITLSILRFYIKIMVLSKGKNSIKSRIKNVKIYKPSRGNIFG